MPKAFVKPRSLVVVGGLAWAAAAAVVLSAAPVLAQAPEVQPAAGAELVDRVVAVVGDSALFYSQVQDETRRRRAQGLPVPPEGDSAAMREFELAVLGDLVNQSLLLVGAQRDTTVAVPQARVDQAFDGAWAERVQQFGSEAELSRALAVDGLTLAQYRTILRQELERELMLQTYIQAQRESTRVPPVEEAAMQAFFERERGALGQRPPTLTFEHVVFAPQPSDSVRAASRAEAEEVVALLDQGEDFGDLARRFSDDPGSGPQGGELGWVRRGVFVTEFEDVAFQLRREAISGIVETQFGAHIIQVQRINGPERLVRHILIAAAPTPADVARARDRAIAVGDSVAAGTAALSSYADEGEPTGLPNPTTLSRDQLGQLPQAFAQALSTAAQGDVLAPLEIQPRPGESTFAVLHVTEVREAGEMTYEDVREQIRSILQDREFELRLLERLRAETFVEIRL